MNKRFALLILLVILTLITSGCSLFTPKEKTNEPELVSILLDWFPNTNHTGLFVAGANGYFADHNI